MHRYRTAIFVLVPWVILAAYVAARAGLPRDMQKFIFAENGVVELGTAVLFLVSFGVSVRFAAGGYRDIPLYARAAFGLFAFASLFVALEEVSYGQQLFGWRSPDWFERNNHHGQTNLHNLMGNRPSHTLKNLANHGSLVGFVIVPLAALLLRHTYRPGHWTHYVLPKAELWSVIAVAQLCSVLWDIPKTVLGTYWHQGWNELREFFWGLSAVGYVLVMHWRFTGSARAADSAGDPSGSDPGSVLSRAA